MTNITLRAENITIGDEENKILFRRFRGFGTNKRIEEKDVVIINGLLEKLGIPVGRNLIGNLISFSWTEGDIRKTMESVITEFSFTLGDKRIKSEHDFSVYLYFDNKAEKMDMISYFGRFDRREPYVYNTKFGLIMNDWHFFPTPDRIQQTDSPKISFIKDPRADGGKYLEFYIGTTGSVYFMQGGPHVVVSEEKNGDSFVTSMCLGRCRYKKTWRKDYMRRTFLDQPLMDWNRSSVLRVKVLS